MLSSSRNFSQMFLPDLLEKILSFRGFCRKQKRWKSLDAMSGEYGGWDRTDQHTPNIFPV